MYDRVQDLPDIVRLGLPIDTQQLVRGMLNSLVLDSNTSPGLAMTMVQKGLEASGYKWESGKWSSVIGKKVAEGVITKVAEDKHLVFGWASIAKDENGKILLDRQDDFIDDPDELEKSAYDYVLNSRDGGVMHVQKGASRMVESMVFTPEKMAAMGIPTGLLPVGWWIGYHVDDQAAWEEVKKGTFTGFSVHGKGIRKQQPISDETHSSEGR